MPRTFLWNDSFLSNFCFVIWHLTATCLESFANFVCLLILSFTSFHRESTVVDSSRFIKPPSTWFTPCSRHPPLCIWGIWQLRNPMSFDLIVFSFFWCSFFINLNTLKLKKSTQEIVPLADFETRANERNLCRSILFFSITQVFQFFLITSCPRRQATNFYTAAISQFMMW